jgi:hypothetical protein
LPTTAYATHFIRPQPEWLRSPGVSEVEPSFEHRFVARRPSKRIRGDAEVDATPPAHGRTQIGSAASTKVSVAFCDSDVDDVLTKGVSTLF